MPLLGIETSCDETGAAVVKDGTKLLSNVVSSSAALHQKYGGVVPEVAAREQIKVIVPVICQALDEAKTNLEKIDALAVTVGPGLIGSLLVGVETAKTLALIFKKPIIPVNHLYGHLYANWLTDYRLQTTARTKAVVGSQKAVSMQPNFPLVALIVSGGHTDLILMKGHGQIKWLGGTRDDAAGEAFDKVARFLGLSYPGGPAIEKVSERGDVSRFTFPRPMIDEDNFDFSFSGLKTAVVQEVRKEVEKEKTLSQISISNLASSFQQAIVDVLVTKTIKAAQKYRVKEILLGGGVAANSALRLQLTDYSKRLGIPVRFPPVELCTDNGVVIASVAFFNFKPKPPEKIQAKPGLYF
jgi:N6-L-threonylcarbamoyladenine synthase